MRKQLLFIILISISCIESFSQIIFENGYFIDESNNRIECLIKNIDWQNNPSEFNYKLTQNDEVQKATIKEVKEFGINNFSKYIRAKVDIDRSSNEIDKLSYVRNPEFEEELLFLKVLLEGQASLYVYYDGNLTRFFYNINDSTISQLVYKEYLIDQKIAKNNYFKQQLFIDLKCDKIFLNNFENLRYNKQDFERLFRKYNECNGSSYIIYENKQEKKDLFNITIRPALSYSSLDINNISDNYRDTDFGGEIGVRCGIEFEFILPFNKNKWGIIIEPTYQYFKSEKTVENSATPYKTLVSKVEYNSIELPIGLRHYFYLNNNSKLFANISYVFDFAFNSDIEFHRVYSPTTSLDVKTRTNLAFGAGYKYKNRYSVEIRYNTNRDILSQYMSWKSNYNSFNLIFGLSLL